MRIALQRLLLLCVLVVAPQGCQSEPAEFPNRDRVAIETQGQSAKLYEFYVELASTPQEVYTGLRWRTRMAADHGMLFDLGSVRVAYFTMSDTRIPLDMLFIAQDGKIVKIAKMTQPGNPGPYTSEVPVKSVLELNGGTSDRLGIKTGDSVRHKLFATPAAARTNP